MYIYIKDLTIIKINTYIYIYTCVRFIFSWYIFMWSIFKSFISRWSRYMIHKQIHTLDHFVVYHYVRYLHDIMYLSNIICPHHIIYMWSNNIFKIFTYLHIYIMFRYVYWFIYANYICHHMAGLESWPTLFWHSLSAVGCHALPWKNTPPTKDDKNRRML